MASLDTTRVTFDITVPINVESELRRLKVAEATLRPELDNPKWGIKNVFEDGCGNLLMIAEKPA